MQKITVLIVSLALGNTAFSWGMSKDALEALSIVKKHFGASETAFVDYDAIRNFDFETPLRANVSNEVYKKRLMVLGSLIGRNIPKEDYVQNLQLFYDAWPIVKATAWSQFADFNSIGGLFVELPHPKSIVSKISTSIGTIIRMCKAPQRNLLHITDPIAIGMLIRLHRIEARKKSNEDFIIQLPRYLRHLNNSETQARVVANFLMSTTLMRTISDKLDKKVPEIITKVDDEVVQDCYSQIPYLDPLSKLSVKYFKDREPYFGKDFLGNLIFNSVSEKSFENLKSYGSNLAELIACYRALHHRVLTKMINPDVQTVLAVVPQPKSYLQVRDPQIQEVESVPQHIAVPEKVYTPLKYHKRVTCWFSDKFVNNKKTSSITYHTLLPRLADPIVVADGICSEWDNKTIQGQKDNLYRIPGKVMYDDGGEKFYIFESCIGSDGICYHRGCKNTAFDAINQALDATLDIPREFESDKEDYGNVDEQTAAILEDNDEYVVVNNPKHNCKIFLFKLSN